jgi:hypothetical protein
MIREIFLVAIHVQVVKFRLQSHTQLMKNGHEGEEKKHDPLVVLKNGYCSNALILKFNI